MLTALGDLLLARSEFDAALESYRAAIERAPSDDYAHYRLGWALYLAGEPDESVFETLTAMRLSPVFLPVVANVLGAGMYLKGDLEGALAVFEEQLDPPASPGLSRFAYRQLALVLADLGRNDEARLQVELHDRLDGNGNFTISRLSQMPGYDFKDPTVFDRWPEIWRSIGYKE